MGFIEKLRKAYTRNEFTYEQFPYSEHLDLPEYINIDAGKYNSKIQPKDYYNALETINQNVTAVADYMQNLKKCGYDLTINDILNATKQYKQQLSPKMRESFQQIEKISKNLEQYFNYIYKYEKHQAALKLQYNINDMHRRLKSLLQDTIGLDAQEKFNRFESLHSSGKTIKSLQDNFLLMRPGSLKDAVERELTCREFSQSVSESVRTGVMDYISQPNMQLRYHGCSFQSALDIIESGYISSGADRNSHGYATSSDKKGYFSVTRPEETALTINNYAHIANKDAGELQSNMSNPAGCVFVLNSNPYYETFYHAGNVMGFNGVSDVTKMPNVSLYPGQNRPPENSLNCVLTTQENLALVESMLESKGIQAPVVTFKDYQRFLTEQTRNFVQEISNQSISWDEIHQRII